MGIYGVIDNIAITVSDINRTVEWYSKNFGLVKTFEDNFTAYESGFFVECPNAAEMYDVSPGTTCPLCKMASPDGGAALEIFQFNPQKPAERIPWDRPGFTHIGFKTEHFTETYEHLKVNGVEFLMEPGLIASANRKWVFMRDPDGNMVELAGTDPD